MSIPNLCCSQVENLTLVVSIFKIFQNWPHCVIVPTKCLPESISSEVLSLRHFRVVNFGDNRRQQHHVHRHQPAGGDHLQAGQQPEPGQDPTLDAIHVAVGLLFEFL